MLYALNQGTLTVELTKSTLKRVIKEELKKILYENDAQSWSEIIIDKAVGAMIEGTYGFDPPQEKLDMLEARLRALLNDDELVSMLKDITGANR